MFIQRLMTSLVLAPLMLAGIYLLPVDYFSLFIGLIVVVAAWEWANLAGYSRTTTRLTVAIAGAAILLAVDWWRLSAQISWQTLMIAAVIWWLLALFLVLTYPGSQTVIRRRWVRLLMGVPVLVPFWLGLNVLKGREDDALVLTWLMLLVWGADVGAYFAGRAFGKRKLAPNVSPGKTWAGVYGGMATSILVSVAVTLMFLPPLSALQWTALVLVSALLVAISVLGDLLESLLKRYRGIKDSSQLLPGHGGVLDRIDSLCAATPLFCLLLVVIAV